MRHIPGIVVGCRDALETIRPNQRAWARLSKSSRCYVVAMYSNHWPCLFPQHGAGRKHERRLALHDWQEEIVSPPRRHFVRGLIHSDGCRIVANDPGPEKRSIPLPNKSEDIKALYRDSLDALGVHWTQPCGSQVAVYQKSSVAILEEFIGPKR
jgi:hypothetical protein